MKTRALKHSDDWATPAYVYQALDEAFGFTFDPCPLGHNTSEWDGLNIEWGEMNFVNPPYSRALKEAFVKKAVEEAGKGKTSLVLLPVSTSTKLFHEVILPNASTIYFIKKRIKFVGYDTYGKFTSTKSPLHDSMLVLFGPGKLSKRPKFDTWCFTPEEV